MLSTNYSRITNWVKVLSLFISAAGVFVLIGWAFDISMLKSVFYGFQTMKVNTAICFILIGIGLMNFRPIGKFHLVSFLAGFLVLSCSGLTLVQDMTGLNFGIDQFFAIQNDGNGVENPGRMAPITAACFVLIAIALFVKEYKCGQILVPYFIVPVLQLVSSIAIIGYFFNVPVFYKWSFVSSMALNTVLLIMLVSVILSLYYPRRAFLGLLTGKGYGNMVARRIFPGIVLSILILGFLRIEAGRLHLVSEEFGIVVFAYSFILVSTFIVAIVAVQINRLDIKRTEAEQSLANLHQELEEKFEIATKQLQDNQRKFQSIFELSPAGIAITDIKTSKIMQANDSFANNLGYKLEEVIGKTSIELGLLAPEVRKVLIEKLQRDKFLRNEEIELIDRFGNCRFCIFSSEMISINGEVFALTVQYDITERKKLEQELVLAREKAENSSIVKERFMSNMSHEIRTPLNAIIGFTSLIEGENLKPEQVEYLQFVRNSGANLLNLVNDILDYSKIEAGMLRVENIPFSIYDLSGSLRLMFSDKARQQGLEWDVTVDPEIDQLVVGDPNRITQIVTNLLSNAFKFTSKGKVSLLISKSNQQNNDIQFKIVDTGIGISEEQLGKVFERFVQASDETTRIYGGTGLGLSIVNSLAELLGGSLQVESVVNKGTCFTVVLPLKPYATSQGINQYSEPGTADQPSFAIPLNVLVAEDNKMNQILASKILAKMNCHTDIAENGGVAIELLKVKAYDLVLMDIQMPIVDGYTAARRIRKELMINTPIIAMTAHILAGEKERCFEVGMYDYISKPYAYDQLFSTIKRNVVSVS